MRCMMVISYNTLLQLQLCSNMVEKKHVAVAGRTFFFFFVVLLRSCVLKYMATECISYQSDSGFCCTEWLKSFEIVNLLKLRNILPSVVCTIVFIYFKKRKQILCEVMEIFLGFQHFGWSKLWHLGYYLIWFIIIRLIIIPHYAWITILYYFK